jgi:hypothetical protein
MPGTAQDIVGIAVVVHEANRWLRCRQARIR